MRTVEPLGLGPPPYNGTNIVNLMSSILAATGGRPHYAEIEGLERLANARHIVLLVIDGLGARLLESSASGQVMRRYMHRSISSVFPPTTASAITTYLTGLAPRQHGLTGWFMYFKELGTVVTVLPFVTRLGGIPLRDVGVSAPMLLGHVPIFDRMRIASFSVAPQQIAHSEFNRSHTGAAELKPYASLNELFTTIEHIAQHTKGRSFTYAYWPELDRLCHANGVASQAVGRHLAEIDGRFEELLDRLSGTDTAVLLTADHGFVDISPERIVRVADHPELRDSLRVPLCGEPRAAYCYVSQGRTRGFLDYVESELTECTTCIESAALIEQGYFGPGVNHPQLRDRVGDFALLMHEGYAIQDILPGEKRSELIGMHGGLSAEELHVPLVYAEA
jgi:hypothetical protein